jgi:signal transduction histidine kinase
VAEGVRPQDLFAVVAEEVARVVEVPLVSVVRYEPDGSATECASFSLEGELFPVGRRWSLEGTNVLQRVRAISGPVRIDDHSNLRGEIAEVVRGRGISSTVGVPIVVAGRLWGAMVVSAVEAETLPDATENRLADFTELLATAIENAESRKALERVAEEEAALQRVATLVAQGVDRLEIFSEVSEEVGRLFGTGTAGVVKFAHEDDPELVLVGVSKNLRRVLPAGTRWHLDETLASAEVYRTGRSARVGDADWSSMPGPAAEAGRRLGVTSSVASPILVDGRVWGAATVSSQHQLPPDTEERLEKFAKLVATAISNAQRKTELDASRRRIVAASDEARRQIERDLHDGTQQRLVSLALAVRAAEDSVPREREDLQAALSDLATGLADAAEELQELSRGIHPAILSQGGLGPALRTLARRSTVPVELDDITDTRLPEPVEVAVYYVVSEALANAAKHAQASHVAVSLASGDGALLLSIRDDGIGGAEPWRGSGLVGLSDRVAALGGTIRLESRPGEGTHITAELPLELEAA